MHPFTVLPKNLHGTSDRAFSNLGSVGEVVDVGVVGGALDAFRAGPPCFGSPRTGFKRGSGLLTAVVVDKVVVAPTAKASHSPIR